MLRSKDVDVKEFHYYMRPGVASTLWALWCSTPRYLRLKVYQGLMHFGHKTDSPRVTRLPFGLYAKRGDCWVTEALATQYVSIHTTIPVPTVLDVLEGKDGRPFILMTRVPGTQVADMPRTANDLSDEEVATFTNTVRGWFEQLRQLPPPSSGPAVCGFMGRPFMSYRIDHCDFVGPFETTAEFHSQWFCNLPPEADPQMRALQAEMRTRSYRICFTHGDISPNNVLVDENYVPVGLVDWGCAAWMPEYWEMTSSIYIRLRYPGWVRIFRNAFPRYEEEFAVEAELWKYVMPW